MLDQNITTIITAVITVIGTLGGAFGGVLLSNRHSTQLEKLKIDEERNKRNNPIIEEAYTTVNTRPILRLVSTRQYLLLGYSSVS